MKKKAGGRSVKRQLNKLTKSKGQQLTQASGRREISPPKALIQWPQLKGLLSKALPEDGELPCCLFVPLFMFQMLEESFAWDQVYQVSAPWTKEDPGDAELWLAEVGSCAHSQDLQGHYVYEENANKQSHCSNITFWYSLDPKGRLVCSSRAAIAPGKYLDGSKRKFYATEFLQGGNCVCLPSI